MQATKLKSLEGWLGAPKSLVCTLSFQVIFVFGTPKKVVVLVVEVELLLHHIERSQLRWPGRLFLMPLGEVFWPCPTEK